MKRYFDILFSLFLMVIFCFPILLIILLVKITSAGPVFYWSDRVGQNNKIFRMPKFRSMRVGAPIVATRLLQDPDTHLTPLGRLLRRSSLDELPQLWSIFKGDMSFVGPRPVIPDEEDLVALRTKMGVQVLRPGLTGWAQVNGRDKLSVQEKVYLDLEYKKQQSYWFDLKILYLTVLKVLACHDISH